MKKNSIKKWGKKLLSALVIVLGVTFLTFLLSYLSPDDAAVVKLSSMGTGYTQEMLDKTREEMGLNDPFLTQYGRWVSNCLHGDFGKSYSLNKPVTDLLAARLMPTLKLALFAMVIMLAVSVPLGVLSALHKDKPIDYIVRGLTFFGVSIPNFWAGLLLILLFCVQLKMLPVVSSAGTFGDMILPAVTLALSMSAKYTRQVRAAILDELSSDHVIGARARGVAEWKILWRNVFPNALLPLITLFGLSIGSLLGGTSVVEVIFSYPGLGNLAVSAITSYDYNLIQGYVLWVSVIYMAVNLVVDVSYKFIDPRIRARR